LGRSKRPLWIRNSIYLVGARNTPSRRHLDPLSKFFCATSENRCPLIIASPLGGVKISRLSVVKLPFVCVVAHDRRFRRWATAVNVKLILPPRQSRGSPGYASKEPFTEIDRTSAKFRSALCRIPGAPMKITPLTSTNIRPPADYVLIPQSASQVLAKS